jgi:hypothetical protein
MGVFGALLALFPEAMAYPLAWLLSRARDKLNAMLQRDWHEIGWADRLGRVLLIATILGLLSVPLWPLLL